MSQSSKSQQSLLCGTQKSGRRYYMLMEQGQKAKIINSATFEELKKKGLKVKTAPPKEDSKPVAKVAKKSVKEEPKPTKPAKATKKTTKVVRKMEESESESEDFQSENEESTEDSE